MLESSYKDQQNNHLLHTLLPKAPFLHQRVKSKLKTLQSLLQKDLSPDLIINKVAVLEKSQTSSSSTKKLHWLGNTTKK